jgi:EmrB/QacA subfamily drug resistance transporter
VEALTAATVNHYSRRWPAFYVLCLGTLMIVLDGSAATVALPSIRTSLGFSEASLSWVVNAYLLTFGGFLLLGGRLGDIYGRRRIFLLGIAGFTLSSVACSLAPSAGLLVAGRAVQGVGGAVASVVGLSLMMTLFSDGGERARAMGIAGFVASGGGAIGVLAGGALTGLLNWHWIFLVNLPVGVLVCALALRVVPAASVAAGGGRLDLAGAVTVTGGMVLAVAAIVNVNQAGWTSSVTWAPLGGAAALLALFIAVERRVEAPLLPLGLLRRPNVAAANTVGMLWATAMFAWFFISALYLQLVLHYSPLGVGLAFLPANLLMGVLSIGISGKLVMRFGLRLPLTAGLLLAATGLALLARAPEAGTYLVFVLPSMLLLATGAGIAFSPVLLAAMTGVAPEEAGLASGFINTSFQLGGALGLAMLASVAASGTSGLVAAGDAVPVALVGGYHLAFVTAAGLAAGAAVLAATLLRTRAAIASTERQRLEINAGIRQPAEEEAAA